MGGLNGYAKRVNALEELIRASEPETTPEQRAATERYGRLCERLFQTMDASHVAGVVPVWSTWARDELPTDGRWVHIATIAQHMVGWAYHGDDSFRLALPRTVGAVYLAHRVWPFDQCTACLLLPYAGEHWRGAGLGKPQIDFPPVRYFETCPDCGGMVDRRPIQVRRPA